MNEFMLAVGWTGIYSPMAMGAIGSAMGCAIAGQAGIGAMLETEGGYGRFIKFTLSPNSFVRTPSSNTVAKIISGWELARYHFDRVTT